MPRGSYSYSLNGAPAAITETWCIETLANERRITVSERHAPQYGSRLRVEALESEGRITRFEVAWANSGQGAVPDARATYIAHPEAVEVSRFVEGRATAETYPVNGPLVISPLLRIFMGPVIRQVAALGQGRPVNVLAPWILDPADRDRLLTPKFEPRSARRLGADTVPLGASRRPADKYTYVGETYDDTAEFWLDDSGLLLGYRFTQNQIGQWEVWLSEIDR
jgi:hypothetical protein